MTSQDLIARARSQIGLTTTYTLGGGTVSGDSCRDGDGACDCSGFVLWCLGLKRRWPDLPWLKEATGGWLNTDGLWYDGAVGPCRFVSPLTDPRPGAIIVYPASWMSKMTGPKVGHCGIVSTVGTEVAQHRVVHCSAGNVRRNKDAIAETGLDVFMRVPSARFFWPNGVERPVQG
jgi:hypothetical protein